MFKSILYRLVGLLLIAFSASTWVWMLGGFAHLIPTATLTATEAQWASPGVIAMPATISIITGLIGLLFLLGALPLRKTAASAS